MNREKSSSLINDDPTKNTPDESTPLLASYNASLSDASTEPSSPSSERSSNHKDIGTSSSRYLLCSNSCACTAQARQGPSSDMAMPRILPDLDLDLDLDLAEMRPGSLTSSLDLDTPSLERELASESLGDTCEDSPTAKPRMPDVRWYVEPYMMMYGTCYRPEDYEGEETGLERLCSLSWLSLSTLWSWNTQSEDTADNSQPGQADHLTGDESSGRLPPGYFLVNGIVYMPSTPQ